MASSTCPHCKNDRFELVEVSPAKSKYKMFFVQCSSCGAPCGVTEYYDAGTLVKAQEKALEAIDARLKHVESITVQIGNTLNQIIRKLP